MAHVLSRENCKPEVGQQLKVNGETYLMRGAIGDGAAGLVRKVVRQKDERLFAIKLLAPDPKYIEVSSFDDVAERFKKEGQKGARLDNQFLIKIFAYEDNPSGSSFLRSEGPTPQNPLLLMEFLPGKTLESYIKKTPDEQKGFFEINQYGLIIALQISKALDYLHKRKLIHRDVKPANIFLLNKEIGCPCIKLGDFGIMKWGDFHASLSTGVLTATNQQGLGTLKYMSPEQAVQPRDVTVRSDIYSLGITLFELFTGQILSSPHHVFQIMMARMERGTTYSRYHSLRIRLTPGDERIAEMLLDMHLRGSSNRPSIDKVFGTLSSEYERRFGHSWTEMVPEDG